MSISPQDRRTIKALAQAAVEAAVTDAAAPVAPLEGVLLEPRGCFVTLTRRGRLRGCIGTFQPSGPLGLTLVEMAGEATRDTRFVYDPVTPRELPELTVEVSVLSPLEPTSDPQGLTVGKHGIYIVSGRRSGCFLPEVATDQGWDAATFLSECCRGKAGLPADAWRQPGTRVFLFTSEKI
jgi:AmmeMemoRadiSam system protein A